MDSLDAIEHNIDKECNVLAKYLQDACSQRQDRTPDEKMRWACLGMNLGAQCVVDNFNQDSALIALMDRLEKTDPELADSRDDYKRQIAWFDALLFDKYSFSEAIMRKCEQKIPSEKPIVYFSAPKPDKTPGAKNTCSLSPSEPLEDITCVSPVRL